MILAFAGEQKRVGSSEIQRRRIVFALLAVAVLALGILSRSIPSTSLLFSKYLGDALYAVIFYVVLGAVFPKHPVIWRATCTTVFVIAVECFQLTGVPLQLRQGNPVSKLVSIVLGTKFSWYDMLAYFVGILCVAIFDLGLISRPPVQ